jgi:hypothetical protein
MWAQMTTVTSFQSSFSLSTISVTRNPCSSNRSFITTKRLSTPKDLHAGADGARILAISDRISANICRGKEAGGMAADQTRRVELQAALSGLAH